MIENIGLFILGLIFLVAGAESLIRGAVRIASGLGVSPFIIGFTLIGFGTSAPELVVCLSAALNGSPELALGNVIGSNVANVGLILGIAALVSPLNGHMRVLRVELPLMIGFTGLLWFLVGDNELTRSDGIVLLVGFVGLMLFMLRSARKESFAVKKEFTEETEPAKGMPVWLAAIMVLVGLGGLVGGANLMVTAAVEMAKAWEVSEWLIGLTIVAVGTSLPEVAASVAAALRGHSDIAIGNVIGSNLFNILLILSTTVVVRPISLSNEVVTRDIPVMALFSLMLLPMLANGLKIHRYEGAILLLAYAGYLGWQISRVGG